MKPLTRRQQAVLKVIRSWVNDKGYPPTIRELGKELGIGSLRGVTTHLDAIQHKGFLQRDSRARSIRLADIIKPIKDAIRVPILGRIRAGEPLLAEEHIEGHVVVDGDWIKSSGHTGLGSPGHFALRVQGESMKDAGILDGDHVIVRQQPSVINGEIAVTLLGDEATVKRFFKEDGYIRLQPDNSTMKPFIVTPDQPCTVLGKVIAVFRHIQ